MPRTGPFVVSFEVSKAISRMVDQMRDALPEVPEKHWLTVDFFVWAERYLLRCQPEDFQVMPHPDKDYDLVYVGSPYAHGWWQGMVYDTVAKELDWVDEPEFQASENYEYM